MGFDRARIGATGGLLHKGRILDLLFDMYIMSRTVRWQLEMCDECAQRFRRQLSGSVEMTWGLSRSNLRAEVISGGEDSPASSAWPSLGILFNNASSEILHFSENPRGPWYIHTIIPAIGGSEVELSRTFLKKPGSLPKPSSSSQSRLSKLPLKPHIVDLRGKPCGLQPGNATPCSCISWSQRRRSVPV